MPQLHVVPILAALVFTCGQLAAAEITADDFLPPAQAKSAEQKAALEKVTGTAKRVDDPALGKLTSADSVQDAINAALEPNAIGCAPFKASSGYGVFARGLASYAVMPNPTATRISKRTAYVKAYISAQAAMAKFLGETSNEGRTTLADTFDLITTDKATKANKDDVTQESITQAVQKILKGFVVYDVVDDNANNTVYVSIVSTPKTLKTLSRSGPSGITADNLQAAINQIISEIKSGVVPPVGSRTILIKGSTEIAFVGFGSDIVRWHEDPTLRPQLSLQAQKIAMMRANDALCGAILGDDTRSSSGMTETTKDLYQQFEPDPKDPSKVVFFEKAKKTFENRQTSAEIIQTARKGSIPPGVTSRNWLSDDKAESYALAVYFPSSTAAAKDFSQKMDAAELGQDAGNAANQKAKDTDQPPPPVKKGPSGQVTKDSDL